MPNFDPAMLQDAPMPEARAGEEEEFDLFAGEEGEAGGASSVVSQLAGLDDAALAEVAAAVEEEQAMRSEAQGGDDAEEGDYEDDADTDMESDSEQY